MPYDARPPLPAPSTPAVPPALSVANASFVTDRLLVGGDLESTDPTLAAAQVTELVDAGVTHVLDARLEWDDSATWTRARVSARWAGIDDSGQQVPGEWFEDVVSWCLAALAQPRTKVLTHCHMGINRGPSVGYAVLLGLGWHPVEALDAVRRARPIAYAAYAEDALRWHHDRHGTAAEQRRRDRKDVAAWRRQHHLDLATVVRQVRGG
ncbi:MAG: hypothetical protein CMH83_07825 [Nocardioides sp.]|nr:hypothetical protein [Nocardioides sp.]